MEVDIMVTAQPMPVAVAVVLILLEYRVVQVVLLEVMEGMD